MRRTAFGCMAVGCLLLPVVTLILVLKFISSHQVRMPARIATGTALSIPPPGNARILARKIVETQNKAEWQWTIVGDRNWTTAVIRKETLELGGAYPFNSLSRLGGTHVWTADVTVVTSPGRPPQPLRVDSSLHGSNGTTVTQSWTVDGSGGRGASAALSVAQSTDALVGIPADVPLATAGGRTLSLKLNP